MNELSYVLHGVDGDHMKMAMAIAVFLAISGTLPLNEEVLC
jgi:hypothetical protein